MKPTSANLSRSYATGGAVTYAAVAMAPTPGIAAAILGEMNVRHAEAVVAKRQENRPNTAWAQFTGAMGDRAIIGDARLRALSQIAQAEGSLPMQSGLGGAVLFELAICPLIAGAKALFAR